LRKIFSEAQGNSESRSATTSYEGGEMKHSWWVSWPVHKLRLRYRDRNPKSKL